MAFVPDTHCSRTAWNKRVPMIGRLIDCSDYPWGVFAEDQGCQDMR